MAERTEGNYNLKERFRDAEVKGILLDLDDFILDTEPVFDRQMRAFVNTVVEKDPRVDQREAFKKLIETNNDLFKTHFVRQDKFSIVPKMLDDHFGTGELFYNHRDTLQQIFKTSPIMLPGAEEMLLAFQETGLPMGLVTHAESDWTNLKIVKNDLNKYFKHIEIVDSGRAKGPNDWRNGARKINIDPKYILAGGDNIKGDILPALSIGVRHAVWVKSKYSFYNEGVVPLEVIRVEKTSDVIGALMDRLNLNIQH